MKSKITTRTISLPRALDCALVDMAREKDTPVSRIVRKALVEHLYGGKTLQSTEEQPTDGVTTKVLA